MKKIKQLNLMQTKEKLNQRKTISHLVNIKTEAEKCKKVGKELEEITKRKNNENQETTTYSFQADRQLVQKLMEQREILSNRQEFLKQEQAAITKEISNSKAKADILEKKKLKEKVKFLNKNDSKLEDQYSQIIKR